MRYSILDCARGISIISMILYHTVWDLVYLFNADLKWFHSIWAYVWQQSICISFILLSGFCWNFGRKKLKRGIIVFISGLIITGTTVIVLPSQKIIFGILTMLGSCMLLMIPLEKLLLKIHSSTGIFLSLLLFLLSINAKKGYISFFQVRIFDLPDFLYNNFLTEYFGFPNPEFHSTDYFPLIPWFFLFLTGYFIYFKVKEMDKLNCLTSKKIKVIEFLGKHSLPIYILHQPILYFCLTFIFKLI